MTKATLDLNAQLVPIASVREHPRNARTGDVGAIAESIRANGIYRPLVVQRSTGYVLAGNHTLKALRALNATEVPVQYVECDDDRALRILLIDNRASDLASYDQAALVKLLDEIRPTASALTGTGYDLDALLDLAESLTSPMRLSVGPATCPVCGQKLPPKEKAPQGAA